MVDSRVSRYGPDTNDHSFVLFNGRDNFGQCMEKRSNSHGVIQLTQSTTSSHTSGREQCQLRIFVQTDEDDHRCINCISYYALADTKQIENVTDSKTQPEFPKLQTRGVEGCTYLVTYLHTGRYIFPTSLSVSLNLLMSDGGHGGCGMGRTEAFQSPDSVRDTRGDLEELSPFRAFFN